MEKIELRRDAVIGYIVTQESSDGLRYVAITPIIGDTEGFFDETLTNPISEDRQVIGVLPAQPNTFRVSGCLEGIGGRTKFGYEFAGANNPDWENENEFRDAVNANVIIPELWKIITDLSTEHGEVSEEMILAAAMNIPLFKEWREYDVLDGTVRLQCTLEIMMRGGTLDSPRNGVYTIKRADVGTEPPPED